MLERMRRLNVRKEDIREEFLRSSGPGGQNVNKTATCVRLVHIPSGTHIKCQATRSQIFNRARARSLLLDKIEKDNTREEQRERDDREKIRRQKRKRSIKEKERFRELKGHRSEIKTRRRKFSSHSWEAL